MNQALFVNSSPRTSSSVSRSLSLQLEKGLCEEFPSLRLIHRDLAQDSLPHLTETMIQAFYTSVEKTTKAQADELALSDTLVDELLVSDLVVLATPVWNFNIPASVKAWIDLVCRAGRTFSYSSGSPRGLLKVKRVIVIKSSGGVFSEGPNKERDFSEPYLKSIFGFLGVPDIRFIRAEGLSSPQLKESGLAKAVLQVETELQQLRLLAEPVAA